MQALKAQSEDVVKNIGMALIPILEKLVTAIKDVVDWFGKHKAVAEAVGILIGSVLVTAIGAYLISLGKAAIESVIAFAKMVAGWFGLGTAATVAGEEAVVAGEEITVATGGMNIAIGLVAAAIIYLATHWKETWNAVKDVIKVAWDWIKDKVELIWHLFTKTSPFGMAIQFIIDHWSTIFKAVKEVIADAWHFIENVVGKIVGGIKGFIGLVKDEINGLISLINMVIRAIDGIHVKIPSWVPLIGGSDFHVDIPTIPLLAEGGIVTSPTLAMIGEAGSEAVIPLSKMGGMGGVNVVVQVQGSVIQEKDLAITVRDNIAQLMRRRGLDPAILGV
jgi:hypothetical protein